jgi:chromate transporter
MSDAALKRGEPAPAKVTLLELIIGFGSLGLIGFGAVLPWTRWIIVEKRKWMTDDELVRVIALCQFLPGPNICNTSVCIGARFQGLPGAVVSLTSLMLAPAIIVIGLASLYEAFAYLPAVQAVFRGVSAAAAGLIVAMGLRFLYPHRRNPRSLAFVALAFVAIVIFKIPLLWIVATLVPASIAASWMFGR